MDKNSPFFRDGIIVKTETTENYVQLETHCSAVENGHVSVHLSVNRNGRFCLSFSGLGNKQVKASQLAANGIEILVTEN